MPDADRLAHSNNARQLLERQGFWKAAGRILFYAPLSGELDVWPLFEDAVRAGKEAYLPRFVGEKPLKRFQDGPAKAPLKRDVKGNGQRYVACAVRDLQKDLKTGQFGIREPVEGRPEIALNRLDFVLVPGIAFDLQGRRLGRGKGYYDRLLAEVRGKTCGVAFDEQIVDEIPVEPHDIHVNCILTPTRWIEL
jgi:5-formyltetrahydrofolate cyclo-ligase